MAEPELASDTNVINIGRASPHACTYCGSPFGVNRDHVIPTCYLREKRRYEGDWLVAACSECNSTLGSQLIFNVPDRAAWVLAVYRQKYRKLLRAVRWCEDELEEIGYTLRQMIEGAQRERAIIERRIRHLEGVAAQPITYMAHLRPAIDDDVEDVPEFCEDDAQARRNRRRALLQLARRVKHIAADNMEHH